VKTRTWYGTRSTTTATILFCALVGWPAIASAARITETITFTASGFTDITLVNPAPQDPVSGSFTLTFDPTVLPSSGPLDAVSLTIAGHTYTRAEVGFETYADVAANHLVIYGLLNGSSVVGGTTDFFLHALIDAQGNFIPPTPGNPVFDYSVAGSGVSIFQAVPVTVTATRVQPAVSPLQVPTLALPMLGLLSLIIVALAYHLLAYHLYGGPRESV
jgi:hypothetical protein